MASPSSGETTVQSQSSLIFTIPPELRLMIYGHVLLQEENIKISALGKTSRRAPGVTQTCRQLRAESWPIYLQSRFVANINFEKSNGPKIWTDTVIAPNAPAIKSLTLVIDTPEQPDDSTPKTLGSLASQTVIAVFDVVKTMLNVGVPLSSIAISHTTTEERSPSAIVSRTALRVMHRAITHRNDIHGEFADAFTNLLPRIDLPAFADENS